MESFRGVVTVVAATWHGTDALELSYKGPGGALGQQVLYCKNEAELSVAQSGSRPFDAAASDFKLVAEAQRISLAGLFDPMLAVATSDVQPLPHQIRAVYGELLPRTPLRFLLADDPGAGKTIMAGLYIKELLLRDDVRQCLIVAPGGLVEQWQDELFFKFGLRFYLLTNQLVDSQVNLNVFETNPLLIARMDQLSRNEQLQAQVKRPDAISSSLMRLPTPEEALKLQLPPATPIFEHIRVGSTDHDRPIRVMVTIAPGDRWELTYDLPVIGPEYHIRKATTADIDRLLELRAEGEKCLQEAGIEQWTYTQRAQEKIPAAVRNGYTWVLSETKDGPIIGGVSLEPPDMDFWTEDDDLDDAVYVYKLVIDRAHKGLDLGGVLLDFAGEQAVQQGKHYVRLDCWRDNKGLHAYYNMHEFTHIRTVEADDRMSGALFQRPAERRTRGDVKLVVD